MRLIPRHITLSIILALTAFMALPRSTAQAQFMCYDCSCIFMEHAFTQAHIRKEHQTTRDHFGTAEPIPDKPMQESGTGELGDYQNFMIFQMYGKYIEPMFRQVASEMTTANQSTSVSRASLSDGRKQSRAIRTIQAAEAEIAREQQPSVGLCSLATNTSNLAPSQQSGSMVSAAMNQLFLARHAGETFPEGPAAEREARLEEFRSYHCSPKDNNAVEGKPMTGFGGFCKAGVDEKNMNRDVDFMQTFMLAPTLELDPTDGVLSDDERALNAMQNYLYGDIFRHVPKNLETLDTAKSASLATSAWIAKMNQAASSFFIIAGMKSQGPENSLQYMRPIMRQLGVGDDEQIKAMIGERPSFLAQLEVLSKRVFQSDQFFMYLQESPENVTRYKAALQSINNIVEQEIIKSQKRSEALLAQYLELENVEKQRVVQSNINRGMR